jgi:integrase
LSPDLGLILLFAMLTGMRRGELCGIQWSDIDWVGSRLTVRRSVWQIRSTWGLKDPKTHQVRTIALDPVTMSILTVHKAKAESEAAIACVPLSSDAFVWSTQADGLCPRTRTVSREHFTASVARWKPKRLPLIPHEWSHGTSASMIFVT